MLGRETLLGAIVILLLSAAIAAVETDSGQWNVHIRSDYPYKYNIIGNDLKITITVDYVAKNACYGIIPEVSKGNCDNCYNVVLTERTPAPGRFCAEVIRQIPIVSVTIPLNPDAESRDVYVNITEANAPAEPIIPIECVALEGKIVRTNIELQMCQVQSCDQEKVERLKSELEALQEEYKKECKEFPPKIKPIIPKPSPVPPDFNKIHIPVPMPDLNVIVEDGKKFLKVGDIKLALDTELGVSGNRIVSMVSGKPVDLNVEAAIKRVQKMLGNVKVDEVAVKDLGSGPVYEAKVEKEGKLLGIFPVKMTVTTIINGENLQIERVEKPWWSALVWG